MALLSDQAKLHWPWFFLASNGYARMELNYRRFVARVFNSFTVAPTEQEFWAFIEEYRKAYLLFVYQAGPQVWGQWDTSEKYLPRHKRKEDEASPIPPVEAFLAWKQAYADFRAKSAISPVVATFAENFRRNARVEGDVVVVVDGVVGGVGDGSASRAVPPPETRQATPTQTEPSRGRAARRDRESGKPSNTEPDAFDQYWDLFVAAGKALNEKDRLKVCQIWVSHDCTWQQAALADARHRIANGDWPDARRTAHPKNHLYDEPWTRVAQPRTLPTSSRDTQDPRERRLAMLRAKEERKHAR